MSIGVPQNRSVPQEPPSRTTAPTATAGEPPSLIDKLKGVMRVIHGLGETIRGSILALISKEEGGEIVRKGKLETSQAWAVLQSKPGTTVTATPTTTAAAPQPAPTPAAPAEHVPASSSQPTAAPVRREQTPTTSGTHQPQAPQGASATVPSIQTPVITDLPETEKRAANSAATAWPRTAGEFSQSQQGGRGAENRPDVPGQHAQQDAPPAPPGYQWTEPIKQESDPRAQPSLVTPDLASSEAQRRVI